MATRRSYVPYLAAVLVLSSVALVGAVAVPDLETGKKTYMANCLVCHGIKGNGKGPAGMALKPSPADFTKPTFWSTHPPDKVSAAIRSGVPGTGMSAFPQISDDNREALVAFLQTLVVP